MQNSDRDSPKEIRQALIRKGGLNPYRKPMWRVCLAQNVYVKRGGIFHEVSGEKSLFTVGTGGRVERAPLTSRVIGTGVIEVRRYPHEGWILERWMPAHVWGPREWWEAQRGENGMSLLGPYPTEGGYYMIAGPWTKLVELGDLELAIAMYERQQEARPVHLAGAIRQQMKDEDDERLAKMQRLEQQLEQYRKSEILPMLKRVSLGAQAVRNQLQASLGDPSHFGAI